MKLKGWYPFLERRWSISLSPLKIGVEYTTAKLTVMKKKAGRIILYFILKEYAH